MLALSWSSQWGEIQWDLYVPWHEWCYLIPVPAAPLIFSYRQGPHIASMGKVSSEWLEPGHLSWFQLVPEKLTHPYPLPCPGESLKAQATLRLLCLCGQLSLGCSSHSSLGWKWKLLSIFENLPKLLGPHLGFSQEVSKCDPPLVFTGAESMGFCSSAGLRE